MPHASPAATIGAPAIHFESASDIVSEICASALLLGVQLRSSRDFGEPAALRRRTKELLDHTEEALRAARVAEADVRDIIFALVSFLDESVSLSPWSQKGTWLSRPMQLERFDRYDAGEEFFVTLDALRHERAVRTNVLEIYFLCLTLGFKGKYQLLPDEEWQELVTRVGAELRRDGAHDATALSPHGLPSDTLTDAVKEMPAWVFAAAVAATALVIYVVLAVLISWRAGRVDDLLRLG
jgi:type VI secretion system protein ImpK